MDPDVFITIAFCAEVALFAIGGGLFVRREWRRHAIGVDADRRELARLAGRRRGLARRLGQATDPRVVSDVPRNRRGRPSAAGLDQHEARRPSGEDRSRPLSAR
jgi:hypothetical protein